MNLRNSNAKNEPLKEESLTTATETGHETGAELSDQTSGAAIETAEQTHIVSGAGRTAVRASMADLADQIWSTNVYPGILGDISSRPSL